MTLADRRKLPRALIVTAFAVVLAELSWMSGVSRMGADSTERGKAYFGGAAAAQIAFDDLAAREPHAALDEAQHAVRTAPVDPSTTSALGSAALTLGRAGRAYAAFTVAGSLGWRDVPTQLYWLSQAVADGDVGVAAQRLDALLRLDIDSDAVAQSLDMLERTDPGRVALATLLMKDPPWESRFLIGTGLLDGDDFAGRVAAIDLAAAKGAAIDCDAVGNAANRLIVKGRVVAAKELWRHACDRAADLYLSDGSFESDPAKVSANPFDWRLRPRGGLEVAVAPAPRPLDGQALRIGSSLTVRTDAARQLTVLQPGRYRLAWKTAGDDGKPDDSISVLVRCNGQDALDLADVPTSSGEPNRVVKTFMVPSHDCPIQAVEVQKAASISGDMQTGWIDDIRIAPLG